MVVLNRPIINRFLRNDTTYGGLKIFSKEIINEISKVPFLNMICLVDQLNILCYYDIKEKKIYQTNIYHSPYRIVVSSVYVNYSELV